MKTSTVPKPKERIVDTSARLFYGRDAHTVGVDMICEAASVSKRTLYKHFPTKEALVNTAVSTLADAWAEIYTDCTSSDPAERIRYVFTVLEPRAGASDFYGCVLMNTSIELRNAETPAKSIARKNKHQMYDYFKQQATLLGAQAPATLAEQLVLLFDGCNAWIVMNRAFPASTYATLDMLLAQATRKAI